MLFTPLTRGPPPTPTSDPQPQKILGSPSTTFFRPIVLFLKMLLTSFHYRAITVWVKLETYHG